ncbi:hypothetical protein ABVK25_010798 [Lepraria finkii]|uniref:Ferric reductase NAD binding domain-containing protein n=1 Tax=Lepraria finkii TaxID=1340010 RepID=A0ABR4AUJ8_9LECA
MISWWDNDHEGRGVNIYLLVKPGTGFTQKLLRHAGSFALKAWVDGPYGQIEDIGNYGSVVMFASGIGIAAQVPYIKELLKGFHEYRVRTKSILLVWQLDKESDQEWVQDWMTELLSEDEGSYILRIGLYVLRNFDDSNISYGHKEQYGDHDRVRKLYGKPYLEKIIGSEVEGKRGQLLITTSTECHMQDQVQKLVARYLDKDVKLLHLAFQPEESQSFWAPKLPEVKYEGVV